MSTTLFKLRDKYLIFVNNTTLRPKKSFFLSYY